MWNLWKTSLLRLMFLRIKWRQHYLLVAACITEHICAHKLCTNQKYTNINPSLFDCSAQTNDIPKGKLSLTCFS